MAQTTPDEVLRRVLRLSSVNGLSVAIFAGLCALGSLVFGDLLGAGVGLLVAIGGITEVRGRNKLRQRDADGMRLLVRAQWMVLGVIWVYAASRIGSFDAMLALDNQTPEMRQMLAEAGVETAQLITLVKIFFYVFYSVVMLVTLIYQGGLALYYKHRTPMVAAALSVPPAAQ
jgi:hypothetical protein|uniref:hypothetical protein n=1 Tax=Cephaloticoccus sp. TaxID=1985742 RepID=UPI00404943E2